MNTAQYVLTAALRCYRLAVSPVLTAVFAPLGFGCRFHPTCSCYAIEAIQKYGAVKGMLLGSWRLCRCHPFGGGGHDPVPASFGEACSRKRSTAQAPIL